MCDRLVLLIALVMFGPRLPHNGNIEPPSSWPSTQERQEILSRHSPILMTSAAPLSPIREYPLDLEWWVGHCTLFVRDGEIEPVKSVGALLDRQAALAASGTDVTQLRLAVAVGEPRTAIIRGQKSSKDPSPACDPTVYGRVIVIGADVLRVQYLYYFGQSIQEPHSSAASTEGDWICVDFDIDYRNRGAPRFVKAIFHNHGRQIIVDDPQRNLERVGTHPRVYLEDSTHEAWPMPGDKWGDREGDGFIEANIPVWVWTNHLRSAKDAVAEGISVPMDISPDWIEKFSSRGHSGRQELPTTNVVDITDPSASEAARLIYEFRGLWGNPIGVAGRPPVSPRINRAIWERRFADTEDARGTRSIPTN